MALDLENIENADGFKTMNNRIQAACSDLLSDIETSHAQFKTSWGRSLGEESKKSRRKSDVRKSLTHIGNTTKSLNLLSGYLDSLEKLKVKHTKNFVECIRSEIVMLWDNCSFGEEQRKEFESFCSETFSEELLVEHEEYLRILKQYYNNNKELFKLVMKREKLWEEKVSFENPVDGCSRFENRGGTLIKELKRYQVVEKQLPTTEKQIRNKVKVWQKSNKKVFSIKDYQYIKYVDQQKAEYKAEQEMKRQAKRLAKQEELLLEMSHDSNVATKRTSVYDNSLSKTAYKKFNEDTLKELMKPTESFLLKSRMPINKSSETPAEGSSKSRLHMTSLKEMPSARSRLSLKSSSTSSSEGELPSKLSKMDLSSRTPLVQKVANSTCESKISHKVISKEHMREITKPTQASLSKSRLPTKTSGSENIVKRKRTLLTKAQKSKSRRCSVRVGEKKYLKEQNILEESSACENG